MIRRTSFNEQFKAKIRQAMREAIKRAVEWQEGDEPVTGKAYVHNRRGNTMMRIDYNYGHQPAFRFWEGSRVDITNMTTEALGGRL